MITFSVSVKVLMILLIHSTSKAVESAMCLEGEYMKDPSVWNATVTCGKTEVCYTKKISTKVGMRYTMGCLANSLCSKTGDVTSMPHSDIIGKRLLITHTDEITCHKCCSGDNCNRNLCHEDPRCTDREPRDCSDPKALVKICKYDVTATFCVKSCRICPVDGGLSDWTMWTTCSCNNGTQIRQRSCTNPIPKHGGNNCTGQTQEIRKCDTSSCSIDGGFSQWSQWNSCSKTCGSGTQLRHRNCSNPAPLNGGSNCTGSFTESKQCSNKVCHQVKWSEKSKLLGGPGGVPFDDSRYRTYGNISGLMQACTDNYIFKLQLRYGGAWTQIHGGDNPDLCPRILKSVPHTIIFDKNERLSGVTVTSSTDRIHGNHGVIIESVQFMTNQRLLPICGYYNPQNQNVTTIHWEKLKYLSGRAACLLDALEFHWIEKQ